MARTFDLYAMGQVPVLSFRHQPLKKMRNRLIKRLFDIAFSGAVLICSPLVFIPIAIAIKMTSPGPVFFSQKRTGYRGREFNCLKFRTMKVNSDADKVQASKDDPGKRVSVISCDALRSMNFPSFSTFLKATCRLSGHVRIC